MWYIRSMETIQRDTMETNHTPGPWTHCPGQDTIWAKDGELLVARTEYTRREMAVNEDNANARLIAAAPELLEALTELAALADFTRPTERAAWIKARAAIAKATGQS